MLWLLYRSFTNLNPFSCICTPYAPADSSDRMKTEHKIILGDARNMKQIKDESVDLMITSLPYPMIQMCDEMFEEQNPKIKKALKIED